MNSATTTPTPPPISGWITALRAPAIAKLAADDGPLQMSLFDTQDLAEIAHPDYPGNGSLPASQPRAGGRASPQLFGPPPATDKLLAAGIADR